MRKQIQISVSLSVPVIRCQPLSLPPPVQPHPPSLETAAHQALWLHRRNMIPPKKTNLKLVLLQNYSQTFVQILSHKLQYYNNSIFPMHKLTNQIIILFICIYFFQCCSMLNLNMYFNTEKKGESRA